MCPGEFCTSCEDGAMDLIAEMAKLPWKNESCVYSNMVRNRLKIDTPQ